MTLMTKAELRVDILALDPKAQLKSTMTRDELVLAHDAALDVRHARALATHIGTTPTDAWTDDPDDRQQAWFIDHMGWALANTIPRLTRLVADVRGIQKALAYYQRVADAVDDVLDDGTLVTTADVAHAYTALVGRIKGVTIPSYSAPQPSDMRTWLELQGYEVTLKRKDNNS